MIDAATVTPTPIAGLLLLRPKSISDERGTIREFYRDSTSVTGEKTHWAQVNLTWTRHHGVRGLHGEATTKLVGIAFGTAFGAYLDTRAQSATRGTVITIPLTVDTQVLVPPGVCNGFQATSVEGCQYLYFFDQEWRPDLPGTAVNPLDPDLAIAWPLPVDPDDRTLISAKDAAAPRFREL